MKNLGRIFLFTFAALIAQAAVAASPTSFTYEGVLTDSSGNTVNLSGVTLTFSIVGGSNCVLYKETRAAGDASGNISHAVGTGTAVGGYSPFNASLFNSTVAGLDATTTAACSVTASAVRTLRVEVTSLAISADVALTSVPYALESTAVGGFGSGSLLRAVDGSGSPAAISAFSPTQMTALTDLINGNSTQYATPSSVTTAINSAALTTTQLTQGGATTGQVLKWNGTAWAPGTDAGITTEADPTVKAFAKNTPSNQFVTTGNILDLASSGATAGTYGSGTQIPILTVDAYGRVTSISQTTLTGTSPAGSALVSGQMWIGNASNQATAVVMSGDATITSTGSLSVNKIKGQTLAGNTPGPGSLLVYNNSLAQWEAQALPSCSASETLNFNGVSGAFTCVAINNATYVTGSFAGDVTGTQGATTLSKIQSKTLAITAVADGDVLQFNGTAWVNRNIPICTANQYLTFDGTHYLCVTDAGSSGSVSSVGATLPLSASTSSGNVSLSLNYDNTTIGLNGSNQLTVKDGSITAAKLGGTGTTGDLFYRSTSAWTSGSADTAGVLDKTSAQTITGDKTFSGNLIHNSSGATRIAVGSTPQQPASPAVGMIRINSSLGNKPEYWDGSSWKTVGTGNGTVTSVNSGSSYITVNNNSSTPSISINVGTSANTLAAGDDMRITNALNKTGDIMSGTLNMGSNTITATGDILMGANTSIQLGANAADPDTSGWTTGQKGRTWFDSVNNVIKYWNGSSIQTVGTGSAGLTSLNGSTVSAQSFATPGNSGIAPSWSTNAGTGIHTLNIPMASSSAVTAGLISKTDYDTFTNKLGTASAFSGDVSGTYSSTSVDKIKGTGVSVTTLVNGNILKYNGSAWINGMLDTSDIGTGVLSVARGGTGSGATLNNNRLMISTGGVIVEAPPLSNGQLMIGATGGVPTVATVGSFNGIAINTGSGSLSIGTNATVTKTANALITRDGSGNFAAGAATLDQVTLAASTTGNLTLQAPSSITNYSLTLPTSAGTNGQVLMTNGPSGVLTWTSVPLSSNTFTNGGNNFGSPATLGTINSASLNFKTANTTWMTIDNRGFIGIGTQSPSAPLQIMNSAASPGQNITFDQYSSDSYGAGMTGRKARGTATALTSVMNGDVLASFQSSGYDGSTWLYGGSLGFTVGGSPALNSIPTDFYIGTGTSNSIERFRITSNGNIGIGTSMPQATLEVAGHIAATGANIGFTNYSCTTGNSISISANDERGSLSVQGISTAGTCTITFTNPYPSAAAPTCIVSPVGNPNGSTFYIDTSSNNTKLVVGFTAPTSNTALKFNYICLQ